MSQLSKGFTIVELMITTVIVAIALALAVPSWNRLVEKRQTTSAAEDIASFLQFAQGEAIKRNDLVTVNMRRSSHSNWCLGATLGATACDCTELVDTQADFCAIDGAPYRLDQSFVLSDPNFEILHRMRLNGTSTTNASFAYDPIRGTLINLPDIEIQVHSNTGSGSTRNFGLDVNLLATGRISICANASRASYIGGYPQC